MAPATPTETLQEAPITSCQPGGGLVWGLEQTWGRVRRWALRTFFPGHVRRMTALRQGECPGCAHDVIDARDLKAYRNVCGYSFRPEDDPYRWRGRLGLARYGLGEVIAFSLIFLVLLGVFGTLGVWVHALFFVPVIAVLGVWGFVLSFFRDPERVIPTEPDALVSPADGVVTHLEEIDSPDFAGGKAFRVSIFLSVFNVHVNRIPRSGKVIGVAYYPGAFLDARAGDCARRNEQLWIDVEDADLGCRLRIKQIAGAIARRIVCWLRPGETVTRGQRYGMIKFGSRTDLLLPAAVVAEVRVKVGESVKGGKTVLLRVKAATPGA